MLNKSSSSLREFGFAIRVPSWRPVRDGLGLDSGRLASHGRAEPGRAGQSRARRWIGSLLWWVQGADLTPP